MTRVELYDTVVAWDSPLLHGLTSLSISCVPSITRPVYFKFWRSFVAARLFKTCIFKRVFRNEDPSLPSDVVDMAHLHAISLIYLSSARPLHRHILLKFIRAPLLRRVTLSHEVDPMMTRSEHSAIFPIRPPAFPGASGLRLAVPRDGTLEMAIYRLESVASAPWTISLFRTRRLHQDLLKDLTLSTMASRDCPLCSFQWFVLGTYRH